jgi:hypothetical protein
MARRSKQRLNTALVIGVLLVFVAGMVALVIVFSSQKEHGQVVSSQEPHGVAALKTYAAGAPVTAKGVYEGQHLSFSLPHGATGLQDDSSSDGSESVRFHQGTALVDVEAQPVTVGTNPAVAILGTGAQVEHLPSGPAYVLRSSSAFGSQETITRAVGDEMVTVQVTGGSGAEAEALGMQVAGSLGGPAKGPGG